MASRRLSSLFQTWDKLNPNYMERSWSRNRTPSGQPDTPIPVVVWQVSGVFPPHPGDDCWWVLDLRSQAGKCGKLPKTNHSISKKLPLAGCLVILRKKISQFSSNFPVTAKKIWLSGAMFVASDQKWFAFRAVFLADFIWFYHILSTSSSFIRVPQYLWPPLAKRLFGAIVAKKRIWTSASVSQSGISDQKRVTAEMTTPHHAEILWK